VRAAVSYILWTCKRAKDNDTFVPHPVVLDFQILAGRRKTHHPSVKGIFYSGYVQAGEQGVDMRNYIEVFETF
jgi:hypothetical protein